MRLCAPSKQKRGNAPWLGPPETLSLWRPPRTAGHSGASLSFGGQLPEACPAALAWPGGTGSLSARAAFFKEGFDRRREAFCLAGRCAAHNERCVLFLCPQVLPAGLSPLGHEFPQTWRDCVRATQTPPSCFFWEQTTTFRDCVPIASSVPEASRSASHVQPSPVPRGGRHGTASSPELCLLPLLRLPGQPFLFKTPNFLPRLIAR